MNNSFNDFIQYNGVNVKFESNLYNFTQINITSNFYIANDKKDIKEITKVNIDTKIIESKIIKTPKGKSIEGQILTGYKLLCMIDIIAKIEYIPDDNVETIQHMKVKIPAFINIVIDEEYNDCLNAYPSLIVEDIYCKQLEKRKIYLNVNIISVVDIF